MTIDSDAPVRPVAITGASGFVGRALVELLGNDPRFAVRALYRSGNVPQRPDGVAAVPAGELDGSGQWSAALAGIDTVVHAAGRAHVLGESAEEAERAHHTVNAEGTLHLARQAVRAGVRRLVFVSSIKVNGEATLPGRPFAADDTPQPADAYARSKLAAEVGLREVARETGLEVTVIRPPLIYGARAKGNLARLMGLVQRGIPLPLGAIRNRRSLIGVTNLCSAIRATVLSPAASGRTFLAADGDDLSTPELLERLAAAMGRRALLVPVPVPLLKLVGTMLRRAEEIERLIGSLQVDGTAITRELGWSPSDAAARGDLAAMAAAFRG